MAEQPAGGRAPLDFLWEAALAHRTAVAAARAEASAWEALALREQRGAAPGKAAPVAAQPAAPRRPKVAAVPQGVPGPAVLLVARAAVAAAEPAGPPPRAEQAEPFETVLGAVGKSAAMAKAPPKAEAKAPRQAVPLEPRPELKKKKGRKSSHVRTRPRDDYSYYTSEYYTSSSGDPKDRKSPRVPPGSPLEPEKPGTALPAGAGAEREPEAALPVGEGLKLAAELVRAARGSSQGPQDSGWGHRWVCKDGKYGTVSVRRSTLRERGAPPAPRGRVRRSSPHRRRKESHKKPEESTRSRRRSASKSCYTG